MIYLQLFLQFFKVGLFTVGGGLASIPFLQELGQKTLWFTQAELVNMIAISESTPGAIGVNMATYIGYECAGILGSLLATIGLVAPSYIIIVIIYQIMKAFKENRVVQNIFYFIRPVSVALIASALVTILVLNIIALDQAYNLGFSVKVLPLILTGVLYGLSKIKLFKSKPLLILLLSGIIGLVFSL